MSNPLKEYVSAVISGRFRQFGCDPGDGPGLKNINKPELIEFIIAEGLAPVIYDLCGHGDPLSLFGKCLHQAYLQTAMRNTLLFSEFAKIAEQAKFPVMPLKGAFLTMKVYGNPNLRPMQDIDVLVKKQDVTAMETLLRERGYGRLEACVQDEKCKMKNEERTRFPGIGLINEQTRSPAYSINSIYLRKYIDGNKYLFSDVHVHWHWINASYYLNFEKIDIDEIWKTAREIEWQNGTKAYAVPDELLLLHLAEHNLKHNFRKMVKLLDVAMVLKKCSMDWDRVERYARQFNLIKPLLYTLIFTEDAFPGAVPAGIIRRFDCGPRTHLELRFERMIKSGVRKTGMNWLVYQSMCGGGYGRLKTAVRLAASLFCRKGGLGRLAGAVDIFPMRVLS
ncbi:MAG: nucleotidyltransferase family protein [Planctomycetes bacterium]|nr:nucleotidyltransferase family protein [Planctomycetota bacterium]